jgi:hypothetical protein
LLSSLSLLSSGSALSPSKLFGLVE